ncbi:ribonuclease P protein component 1 [Halocalculus aciditolerans]|uniref:Ribonuclease P protein component 1 n=1 Tax=Halocalculus aciditolerans TaxID=1383812 RepID=A0A830F365_9EURY|nr:ribonuclease P protein component 1 [Halocalculus aciditolerans]GGL50675.1 ribonuclease P [Halocalculus aciditolerans]
MPLTPETLTRHELAGLHVEVVESTDPSRVGLSGRIVRETMNTLVIEAGGEGEPGVRQVEAAERSSAGRPGGEAASRKQVPKRGTVFEFRLTDESAATREGAGTASEPVSGESHTAGYGAAYVTVDGVELLSRPALRSENGVDSKWQ